MDLKRLDSGTELVLKPAKTVLIVTRLGGAGMACSFGLAEEVLDELGMVGGKVADPEKGMR